MTTFTWNDCLTISVGEMSRAQAFDCARQFAALSGAYDNLDDLLLEIYTLGVLNAPIVVKAGSRVLEPGTHQVGESTTVTLPPTRDSFNALPMSLTALWVDAMLESNGWLINHLKKILAPIPEMSSEPASDSGPSSEQNQPTLPTKTTGE